MKSSKTKSPYKMLSSKNNTGSKRSSNVFHFKPTSYSMPKNGENLKREIDNYLGKIIL